MRRGLIVSIAVMLMLMLMLSMAVPVGAKGKPRAVQYEVTMSFSTGDQGPLPGLATTCDGPIVMNGRLNQNLSAAQPRLATSIPVDWERGYPTPGSGEELSGCHGGAPLVVVPPGFNEPEVFGGSLWLEPGPDGTTVSIKWLFDYYWEYVPRNNRKLRQHVLEMFDLAGEVGPFNWASSAPQDVSGTLDLRWFQKIDGSIEQNFPSFGGSPVTVEFVLAIEPMS